jgi:hypothetical protein
MKGVITRQLLNNMYSKAFKFIEDHEVKDPEIPDTLRRFRDAFYMRSMNQSNPH